jgi:hypothetical protein
MIPYFDIASPGLTRQEGIRPQITRHTIKRGPRLTCRENQSEVIKRIFLTGTGRPNLYFHTVNRKRERVSCTKKHRQPIIFLAMTAISKIVFYSSLIIGFAFGGAAESLLRKPMVITGGAIKVSNDDGARVLQIVEQTVHTCKAETIALVLCAGMNTTCADARTLSIIQINGLCSTMPSDVDTFCEGVQRMMTACDQECHDEALAVTTCMLKSAGCDEDHCSSSSSEPDDKTYAGIAVVGLAAGLAAIVYWIHKRR